MQVACFGLNWDEVRKRPNAAAVLALSPERLAILNDAFAGLERPTLSKLHVREKITTPSEEEFLGYLDQWRAAVQFVHERGLGLVAHCG